MIQQRLVHMENTPRALVQAASPFTLTEFGKVARKTGLGSTATRWIIRELEEVLDADPDFFTTIRRNHAIDDDKLKAMLTLALFDPVNLLDSFAIRSQSKHLFGIPISKLEQNVDGFLTAIGGDAAVRDTIRTAIRSADLEFLSRWINGANYSDLSGFFLSKPNPTQIQLDQAIEEVIHTVERYTALLNWSTYYITLLLEHLAREKGSQRPSSELGNLGYYVRWGVNHPLAVFVREELEWGSREDALALGRLAAPEVAYFSNKELFRTVLKSASDQELLSALGTTEKVNEFRRKTAFV